MSGLYKLSFLLASVSPSLDANSKSLVQQIMGMTSTFTVIGGILWAIWGVVVLAGALKDKNGPGLQGGIWQIVGGVLIAVAGGLFNSALKSIGL